MADIERMTVVFPEPMAAKLRAAVERGEYASTSEAVRDAVRLWEDRRRLREEDLQSLRQAWDEGVSSGDAGPFDIERIISRAKANRGSAKA